MEGDYYHTKESVTEYITAAKGFDGKKLIERLKEYLAPASSILEFGSGPGTDWRLLSKIYSVTGSDYSEEFMNHLQKENPEGDFLQIDASTIVTVKKFDGIYSNKVLHHLTDDQLKQSIARQSEVLNSGGVICHSFWKGEGDEEFKGMYVNYHVKDGLLDKFKIEFDILSIEEYKEFEEGDSIVLIAKKKHQSN